MGKVKWTMVRVREETAEAIRGEIRRELERRGGKGAASGEDAEPLTMDGLIRRLLDHVEKDRERSRRWGKSRARRQLGRELAYLNDRYEINPAFEESEVLHDNDKTIDKCLQS